MKWEKNEFWFLCNITGYILNVISDSFMHTSHLVKVEKITNKITVNLWVHKFAHAYKLYKDCNILFLHGTSWFMFRYFQVMKSAMEFTKWSKTDIFNMLYDFNLNIFYRKLIVDKEYKFIKSLSSFFKFTPSSKIIHLDLYITTHIFIYRSGQAVKKLWP